MDLRAAPKLYTGPANNPKSRGEKAFTSIERTAKFVQNLVIIFGIFGGAISLIYAQYDKRVDRAIVMTKEFNSNVRKTYLNLTSAWDHYARANTFTQQADKEAFVNSFFTEGNKEETKAREDNLEDLLDFYDTLYICVDRRSCDRNTALAFFEPSIDRIFEPFAFHIFARRAAEQDPSVGKGLEQLYRMEPEPWLSRYF